MADLLAPQAMPTNAAQATQLPAQYQSVLDSAMMKQALAKAMLERGYQMPQGQTVVTGAGAPNIYVKPALTQNLNAIAQQVLGRQMQGEALSQQMQAMMGYQNDTNAKERQIWGASGESAGTTGAPAQASPAVPGGPASSSEVAAPPPAPAVRPSDQMLARISAMKMSGNPALIAEADKLLNPYAEMKNKETQLDFEQRKAAFDAVAKGATPNSISDAVQHGYDPKRLVPMNPQVSSVEGTLVARVPESGKLDFGPQTEQSALLRQQQSQARAGVEAQGKQLLSEKEGVIAMQQGGETAKAILELAQDPATLQGISHALEINDLKKWGYALGGVKLPQGTTNTDVLHMLGTQMVGAGVRASTGGVGARSVKEWQAIKDSMGPEGNMTPKALITEALNTLSEAKSSRASYDRRSGAFAGDAKRYGMDYFIPQLGIAPEDVPPVSSGIAGSPTERATLQNAGVTLPGSVPPALPGHPGPIKGVVFNPDGSVRQ